MVAAMTRVERDANMCQRYKDGATMEEIRRETGLSRQRVQQILRQNGLHKSDRKVTSDRDDFLGLNLSKPVKAALRKEAQRRGVSMSALSSDVLKDMLKCCGYPVEANSV